MAANTYYTARGLSPEKMQQQHLLSHEDGLPSVPSHMHSRNSSGNSVSLKPLQLGMDGSTHHQARKESLVDFEGIRKAHEEDALLKARIRRLRVISRVLAFMISIAVFVPITITLHKFITTQNVYHDVTRPDGSTVNRTAWAKDSKVWPTWMYFAIAGVSVLLNFAILFSYKFGVEKANKAAYVATAFTWIVMLGNLVVWCVAASLYRTERDKDGKSNDLWGWTCSAAAQAIQKEFANEVDFNRFCNVQSVSWYIGLVQVAAALLTVIIYILVLRRRSTKKKTQRYSQVPGQYPTNY